MAAAKRVSVDVIADPSGAIKGFAAVSEAADAAAKAATDAGDRVAAAAVRQADTAAQAAARAAQTAAAESQAAADAFAEGNTVAYERAAAAADAAALKAQTAWERSAAAAVKAQADAAAQVGTDSEVASSRAAEAAKASADAAKAAWDEAALSAKRATDLMAVEGERTDVFGGLTFGAENLLGRLGNLTSSIPVIGEMFKKMGEQVGSADTEVEKLGAQFTAVGQIAAGVAVAGFAVAADASIKAATTFQASMEMLHTQAGVSQDAIKGLSDQVLALAGPLATSPDQLSESLYHLASNGLRGQQAIDGLTAAAEGAKVGHADLIDVTNALGAVIASNISGVHTYTQAMGDLNATVGAGDMKMQDLAEALGTGVLATVKGFGVTLQDVSAALATFGDNNIRGAEAGTQLRMAIEALAKPAATGKATLDQLGISTTQLAHDMQQGGLNAALQDLNKHLQESGVQGNQVGEILVEAFGKKAGVGINVLMSQLDRFDAKFAEVAKGTASFQDAWTSTTQTFQFQMQQAQATVEALAVKFGEYLIPKLQEAGQDMAGLISWFEQHKAVAEALGITIGTVLTAAIGKFAGEMTGRFVQAMWEGLASVGEFAAGLVGLRAEEEAAAATAEATSFSFSAMLGPIGMVVGALGFLAAAFLRSSSASQQAKSDADQFVTGYMQQAGQLNESNQQIVAGLKNQITAWQQQQQQLYLSQLSAANGSKAMDDLNAKIAAAKAQIDKLTVSQQGANAATQDSVTYTAAAGTTSASLTEKQQELTDATSKLDTAVTNVTTAIKGLTNANLSADQAGISFTQGLDTLTQSLKTNGNTLDINTLKGAANRQAIDSLVTAISDQISAMSQQHASIDQINSVLSDHISQLENVAAQYGISKQQVMQYLQQVGLTPATVQTTLDQSGYSDAITNVSNLNQQIADLQNKTVTLSVLESIGNAAGQTPSGATAGVAVRGFAEGGVLPATVGAGFVTNTPRAIVGEGGPHPEYVIPTDPRYRANAQVLAQGLLGAIGPVSQKTTLDYQSSGIGGAISGWMSSVLSGLAQAAQTAATMGGAVPSGAHLQLIREALGLAGVADTSGNESAVNVIVTHESGWNPNAQNNWDSNAAAGDPSRGLMQTIMTTFQAYALPGYNTNIFDPISNLIAGIRYAVSRYGSLANVPGVASVSHGGSYVGYDTGGVLRPGSTLAMNFTGADEFVFTPAQARALAAAGVRAGGSSGAGAVPSVNFVREIVVQSDVSQQTLVKLNALLDQHDQQLLHQLQAM